MNDESPVKADGVFPTFRRRCLEAVPVVGGKDDRMMLSPWMTCSLPACTAEDLPPPDVRDAQQILASYPAKSGLPSSIERPFIFSTCVNPLPGYAWVLIWQRCVPSPSLDLRTPKTASLPTNSLAYLVPASCFVPAVVYIKLNNISVIS